MTTAYCQTFQKEILSLSSLFSTTDAEVSRLLSDPSGLVQTEELIAKIYASKQKFVEKYQSQVILMLKKWYPHGAHVNISDFLSSVRFENSQRVIIDCAINSGGPLAQIFYIPSLIRKITGDLRCNNEAMTFIDYLEEVDGSLLVNNSSSLRSMKRLRRIGGNANFANTNIESLESLEEAGGLDLNNVQSLKSLPKLKKVRGDADFSGTCIERLDLLEEVVADCSLNNSLVSMKKLRKVGGTLDISDLKIDDFRAVFPVLEEVRPTSAPIGLRINTAFFVPNEDIRKQIKDLEKKGELKFNGDIDYESGKW